MCLNKTPTHTNTHTFFGSVLLDIVHKYYTCKCIQTDLEQALFLGEGVALHGPEVDVRFAAGDDQVGVHGMEDGPQNRVVGALGQRNMGIPSGLYNTPRSFHSLCQCGHGCNALIQDIY